MSLRGYHQELEKKRNEERIKKAISLKGKTNKQLESELEISHSTLANRLRALKKRREIKKEILNEDVVYVLDDMGIINPVDISILSNYLQQITKRKGIAFYDYSQLRGEISASHLPWAIYSHLIMDNDLKKIKLLSKDDVREIEKLIFEKLANNIKKDKIKRNVKNGDFEIGFNVNYSDLLKSIKADSLNYFENMSTAEWNLLRKIDDDPEPISKKDLKKFQNLREKTYEKISKK